MKRACLLLLLHAVALASFAQKQPKPQPHGRVKSATIVNPRFDRKESEGFSVVLKPAIRHTYLFSIYHKGKAVHSAVLNPATHEPAGFNSREAAFRAADWMVASYRKNGFFPEVIPPGIARKLQLNEQQVPQ